MPYCVHKRTTFQERLGLAEVTAESGPLRCSYTERVARGDEDDLQAVALGFWEQEMIVVLAAVGCAERPMIHRRGAIITPRGCA